MSLALSPASPKRCRSAAASRRQRTAVVRQAVASINRELDTIEKELQPDEDADLFQTIDHTRRAVNNWLQPDALAFAKGQPADETSATS